MAAQSMIPEELYNLTQLADVTLAAGKLSTTNIQTIKSYMEHDEPVIAEGRSKTLNDSGYMSDFENATKQKNEWTNDAIPRKFLIEQRQSSFSSSEDDSVYSYSHKIFDKRKSRKLCYQSDDSEACVSVSNFNSETSKLTIDGDESMASLDSLADASSKRSSTDGIGEDIHTCPECGKKYSTSSNLARHRQTHRSLMDKKARRCPHCDKVYVSMPAFSMHVRTHNQGCECPHCGKRFSRPWLLQGHIRTHTGEKPFQCSICSKAFADKSNLRAHIQTHSNTKPHTCSRCGKSFALKSYLYKHEESSCMRNHLKADKERTKATKSDNSGRTKVSRNDTNPTASKRQAKEQKSTKSSVEIEHVATVASSKQECIYLDAGSKKSYIDLTESRRETESYSRISVIQSVAAQSAADENVTSFNYYQEKPVDFSPKNKYKNDFNNENGNNLMEMSHQYATMVV